MKIFGRLIYILFSLTFLIYLALPNQKYPEPSDKSLQSDEPADIESNLRRGYYINDTRENVIEFYRNNFDTYLLFGLTFKLPSLRLNYPPEESQTIIRDQTRSTYLEEIVHPFRQSLYINGFEPKLDKDKIVVMGEQYNQKIIIKLINSDVYLRILFGTFILFLLYINIKMWLNLIQNIIKRR